MVRKLAEVAPGVWVATSRTFVTTSTLVVGEQQALVVDAALHPDELSGLADEAALRGLDVVAGFSTHADFDHVLWHPRLGDVPRWASARAAAAARDGRAEALGILGPSFSETVRDLVGQVQACDYLPASAFPGGRVVESITHDGHAPGHTALWIEDARVLLAGDMLSDIEVPLPSGRENLDAYRAALDLLAPYAARADVVVPGHGQPGGDALARLDADRRYLDAVASALVPNDERLADPDNQEAFEALLTS